MEHELCERRSARQDQQIETEIVGDTQGGLMQVLPMQRVTGDLKPSSVHAHHGNGEASVTSDKYITREESGEVRGWRREETRDSCHKHLQI